MLLTDADTDPTWWVRTHLLYTCLLCREAIGLPHFTGESLPRVSGLVPPPRYKVGGRYPIYPLQYICGMKGLQILISDNIYPCVRALRALDGNSEGWDRTSDILVNSQAFYL